MEEPKVITIDDVIDSTVMDINKGNPLFARESRGNPRGTQGEPSNPDNSNEYLLLSRDSFSFSQKEHTREDNTNFIRKGICC